MILAIRLRSWSTRRGKRATRTARGGRRRVGRGRRGGAARRKRRASRRLYPPPIHPRPHPVAPWRRCTPTPVVLPCRRPPLALAGQPRILLSPSFPRGHQLVRRPSTREPRHDFPSREKRGRLLLPRLQTGAASSATAPSAYRHARTSWPLPRAGDPW